MEPLHDYQVKAVDRALGQPHSGLLIRPGLGKTRVALTVIDQLIKQRQVHQVLVIAPRNVVYNVWPQEIKKWRFELSCAILHGSKKDKTLSTASDTHILLINPEGLKWLLTQRNLQLPDMLVLDESSKFKNTRSERYKLLKPFIRRFKRRMILTGTPTPNGLEDLFGQVYILDEGKALGQYVTHFRKEYYRITHTLKLQTHSVDQWQLQDDGERRIQLAIKPLCFSLDDKDYLKLPPKIEHDVMINMDKKTAELYSELCTEFIHEFRRGQVVTMDGSSAVNKLRQFTGGSLIDNDHQIRRIHDLKIDALADLRDELMGQPAIVAYNFRHELDHIRSKLGKKLPYVGGGVSAKETVRLIAAWNRAEIPLLLVQPQALSHGVNMQEAGRAVIWYTLTYDLEIYDQLIRRIYRQGQRSTVYVYHLLMAGTLDEDVLKILKGKDYGQRQLINAMKLRIEATIAGKDK